jgi:outer membrane biosynthesis protein TonB
MHRRRSLLLIFPLLTLFAIACNNKPNDDAIATEIKAKMFSEPLLKSGSVDVAVKDGVVALTGTVSDQASRLAAQDIASKTNGVRQVIDSIAIANPAPPVAEATPAPPPTPSPKPARKKKPAAPKAEPAPATPASDENTSTADNPPEPPAAPTPPAAPAPPPPPPPPQPITVVIPEGSIVTIRTIDAIDSASSSTGQTFRASLDAPVVVNDRVVLPRGLNVKLKLVDASSAGSFKGRSELTVSLESVTYQGKTYSLQTSDVQQQGSSRGKRSAAVIGGGAALGALIGGLAGGGKGAAIGAGVGAGGGTAVQAATKGQQVKIPSETRLDFTLHAPVPVTYLPPKQSAPTPPPNPDHAPSSAPDQQQPPNFQ